MKQFTIKQSVGSMGQVMLLASYIVIAVTSLLLPKALFSAALNTPSSRAGGSMVDYDYQGTTYEGYFIAAKDNLPLILLVHDWDGLTDYEVKRANMLSELGYAVLAVDLFGKGIRPKSTDDKRHQTGLLYQDRAKMRGIMDAAFNAVGILNVDTSRTVAMGYCFGGAVVLEMARNGAPYKGFATFHGGLSTPEGQDYNSTTGEILVMHGTADRAISMDDFAALAKELEAASIPHELITYGGAPHGFTVFGSDNYREEADEKSWATFLGFISKVLQKNL